MYKLRHATLDDLPSCLVCAKNFVQYYGFDWNEESVVSNLHYILTQGVFIVAEINGKIVGGIGGVVTVNMWDATQKLFQELFWWVDEEYREGSLGIKLLKTFEKETPKDSLLVLSVLPKSNIKTETLNKLGYSLREQAYTRN